MAMAYVTHNESAMEPSLSSRHTHPTHRSLLNRMALLAELPLATGPVAESFGGLSRTSVRAVVPQWFDAHGVWNERLTLQELVLATSHAINTIMRMQGTA
tara:strand:+ start:822 stop:1121 length:300 start_codon:yes stop_codon:yes gene_type:complete